MSQSEYHDYMKKKAKEAAKKEPKIDKAAEAENNNKNKKEYFKEFDNKRKGKK